MQTATPNRPGRDVVYYPAGFAWPARDEWRIGRYVMCPYKSSLVFGLGVVDDFGDLVPVPSDASDVTAVPTTGALA